MKFKLKMKKKKKGKKKKKIVRAKTDGEKVVEMDDMDVVTVNGLDDEISYYSYPCRCCKGVYKMTFADWKENEDIALCTNKDCTLYCRVVKPTVLL